MVYFFPFDLGEISLLKLSVWKKFNGSLNPSSYYSLVGVGTVLKKVYSFDRTGLSHLRND